LKQPKISIRALFPETHYMIGEGIGIMAVGYRIKAFTLTIELINL
tara:strand:+ start:351 stop:485 length:135 start_codon:yes stop_codon:yes gene_type:complete